MNDLAIYRGRFDPPGLHHKEVVDQLLKEFSQVLVCPWGPQPGRTLAHNVAPAFRATMIDLVFQALPRVQVDLRDIEDATITPPQELEARLSASHEVWHVVEADFYAEQAAVLHAGARIVVVVPEQRPLPAGLLPQHRVVRVKSDVNGALMRERLYRLEPVEELLSPQVAAYIERHGLYRGTEPVLATRWDCGEPRVLIVADERNEKAVRWAKELERFRDDQEPNLILVLGGDGSMLHAIQKHWRRRLPFFGVNAGHLGFLLNNADAVLGGEFLAQGLVLRTMPMLHIEYLAKDGWQRGLTFNDAWVERATGQSAWLEVTVAGRVRLPKLVCDGALISTAAGSTAYARSMGAQPLLADTPAWMLVGSNVMEPSHWKSALLSMDSEVELRNLSEAKRPISGFLHGVPLGEVLALKARISRAACVELAFVPTYDMAEKIAQIQFPSR